MSMSTYVVGLRSKDDPTYIKQLKVLNACLEAHIKNLPEETAKYFGSVYPEDVDPEEVLTVKMTKTEYRKDMTEGYEIKVSDIPEGVSVIRFVNSW